METEIVLRRRRWRPEEKAALLAEVEAAGGKVSVVARRHGIAESVLYNWRSARKAAASLRAAEAGGFVPLGLIGAAPEEHLALPAAPERSPAGGRHDGRPGLIEIELSPGARIRVDGFVDEPALMRVLRAIKGSL